MRVRRTGARKGCAPVWYVQAETEEERAAFREGRVEEQSPGARWKYVLAWGFGSKREAKEALGRMRLVEVMREEGRTWTWLAERLGISCSFLTRMVQGERRWTEERKGLAAEALGRTVGELFGGDGRAVYDARLVTLEAAREAGLITEEECQDWTVILVERREVADD